MRLLLIHNRPVWDPRAGGGQRVTHDLAVHLVEAGHEVVMLLVGDGPGESPPPSVSYDTVTIIESRRLLVNAARVARVAGRVVRERGIEVVHASAPEAGWVDVRLPKGVGIAATMHHPNPPRLPPPFRTTAPFTSVSRLRSSQEHLLMARLLRHAHRATVPSRWLRDVLLERGYLDPARMPVVVPNGVSDLWFEDPVPPPDVPAVDLLFVGRLEAQKGLDVLLRSLSMPLLRETSLRVVGDGPQAEDYRRMSTELGLDGRVEFVGFQDHARTRILAAAARVLALPSRHESFGLVALEAKAAGLPVVATGVGGLPEVVRDGVDGVLVPPERPDALAHGVHRILGDDELRRRMGASGRKSAERYRWSRITARMEEELALARDLGTPPSPPPRSVASAPYRRMHASVAALRAPRARHRPSPGQPERVAILRFGLLGDLLILDPLLQSIGERFPSSALELLVDDVRQVPPWLLQDRPHLSVSHLDARDGDRWLRPEDPRLRRSLSNLARRWSAGAPDILLFTDSLDTDPLRYVAARLARMAPDSWKAGITDRRGAPVFLDHIVARSRTGSGAAPSHEIEWMLALATPLGCDPAFRLPRVAVTSPERGAGAEGAAESRASGNLLPEFSGRTVVIHTGASRQTKRWPPARFGQVVLRLRSLGPMRAVFVGGAPDRGILPELGLEFDGTEVIDLVGQTDIQQLADLIAAADLFVGEDSFPMHVAAALRRPTVALVGPSSAAYLAYPDELVRVVRGAVVCSPTDGRVCPYYSSCSHGACMKAVRVEEVVEACRELLRFRGSAHGMERGRPG